MFKSIYYPTSFLKKVNCFRLAKTLFKNVQWVKSGVRHYSKYIKGQFGKYQKPIETRIDFMERQEKVKELQADSSLEKDTPSNRVILSLLASTEVLYEDCKENHKPGEFLYHRNLINIYANLRNVLDRAEIGSELSHKVIKELYLFGKVDHQDSRNNVEEELKMQINKLEKELSSVFEVSKNHFDSKSLDKLDEHVARNLKKIGGLFAIKGFYRANVSTKEIMRLVLQCIKYESNFKKSFFEVIKILNQSVSLVVESSEDLERGWIKDLVSHLDKKDAENIDSILDFFNEYLQGLRDAKKMFELKEAFSLLVRTVTYLKNDSSCIRSLNRIFAKENFCKILSKENPLTLSFYSPR